MHQHDAMHKHGRPDQPAVPGERDQGCCTNEKQNPERQSFQSGRIRALHKGFQLFACEFTFGQSLCQRCDNCFRHRNVRSMCGLVNLLQTDAGDGSAPHHGVRRTSAPLAQTKASEYPKIKRLFKTPPPWLAGLSFGPTSAARYQAPGAQTMLPRRGRSAVYRRLPEGALRGSIRFPST